MQDILVDIENRLPLFSRDAVPAYALRCFWSAEGTCAMCNILLPKKSKFRAGSYDSVIVPLHISYLASSAPMSVRFIQKEAYEKSGDIVEDSFYTGEVRVRGCGGGIKTATPCALPLLNTAGDFQLLIRDSTCEIYPYGALDLSCGLSYNQPGNILTECSPGNAYQWPRAGVSAESYVRGIVSRSDLGATLKRQFEYDDKNIISANFDTESGRVDVEYTDNQKTRTSEVAPLADMFILRTATDAWLRGEADADVGFVRAYYADGVAFAELFLSEARNFGEKYTGIVVSLATEDVLSGTSRIVYAVNDSITDSLVDFTWSDVSFDGDVLYAVIEKTLLDGTKQEIRRKIYNGGVSCYGTGVWLSDELWFDNDTWKNNG